MKYIKVSPTNESIAPFNGVVLTSKLDNKSGSNRNIKKLFKEYKSNELIEGIVFSGDWDKRPLEFLKVLKEIQGSDLKVVINTDLTFDDFKMDIGIASHNKTKGTTMTLKSVEFIDIPMLTFIGGMLIDFYLQGIEYYVKFKEKGEYKLIKIDIAKEDKNGEIN